MNYRKTSKELRDFIKTHEMRYSVEHNGGETRIIKAFKVEIDNAEYWVHFVYGDSPRLIDVRELVKTMEEAKAKAQKLRDEYQRKKKKCNDEKKAKMDEVVAFLNDFGWYGYTDWDTKEIKPSGKAIAAAVKRVYSDMPEREKDDKDTYIGLLENYIRTGNIYSQGSSFHKDQVVLVKYGFDGSVMVELTNGTTIIPKSHGVTELIRTIFGSNFDRWGYNSVKYPTDEKDSIKKAD